MDISIMVAGNLIEAGAFCCPAMSLHETPADPIAKPFEIRLKAVDLIALMDANYSKFIKDIKEDDATYGDPVVELAACGYPGSVRALLHHPLALDCVFGRLLLQDFLEKIQSADRCEPRHFYLTPRPGGPESHCVLDGDEVVFTGMCATDRL